MRLKSFAKLGAALSVIRWPNADVYNLRSALFAHDDPDLPREFLRKFFIPENKVVSVIAGIKIP